MKEIVNRLHENRQIETAKSILESAGYKVTKKRVDEVLGGYDISGYKKMFKSAEANAEGSGEDVTVEFQAAASLLGTSINRLKAVENGYGSFDEEEDEEILVIDRDEQSSLSNGSDIMPAKFNDILCAYIYSSGGYGYLVIKSEDKSAFL